MNPNKDTTIEVKLALRASELEIMANVNGVCIVITNETPEPLKVLTALIEDVAFQHTERVYRKSHLEAFRKLLGLPAKNSKAFSFAFYRKRWER